MKDQPGEFEKAHLLMGTIVVSESMLKQGYIKPEFVPNVQKLVDEGKREWSAITGINYDSLDSYGQVKQ